MTLNITGRPEPRTVQLNRDMHKAPVSTLNHENDVFLNVQLFTNQIIAHKISFGIFKTTKTVI